MVKLTMFATKVLLFITYLKRLLKREIPLKIHLPSQWPDQKPFISVIIPCFNHGQFVDEAIQSVLFQTLQDLEIIIVNDGSTDQETIEILNSLERPKTRVIHLPQNMGLPAARNAGIRKSRGKYICCLDADDKLQATYLEKAVAVMEANAGISFVGSWTQVFGNESRVWYSMQFDPGQIIYYNQFGPPTVFRITAWEAVGGFFEEMREGFEDWEYWVRLTSHGFRGYRISEKLIFYRRLGYSFALRAAEKKDILFEQIKSHNPKIFVEPILAVEKIKRRYRDDYSLRPFSNLQHRFDIPPENARLINSGLNSTDTLRWIREHSPALPLVWVAWKALDEAATDLLYETTPFVYILPNFLPRYAQWEFVQHLKMIWNFSSIHTLRPSSQDSSGARVNSANQ